MEQGTVDLLVACGVGQRLRREGVVHHGINLRFGGHTHRIDLHGLTGGRAITVYAQEEVRSDLTQAAVPRDRPSVSEATAVRLHDLDTPQPWFTSCHDGEVEELHCDFIAGCDGFHGVARPSLPAGAIQSFRCEYQIGWLGMLVEAAPSSKELIYARHEHGFALVS